ncbi:MAG: outer membrane lipoprotein chaperone LolA [Legionella sp.]
MRTILLALLLLLAQPMFADAVQDVQARLNAIRTMSANFNQTVNAGRQRLSMSSGTMALSRPGRFRWQTNEPLQQLVIADGSHLWMYDVDLEQVSVKKEASSISGGAALFLSGDNHSLNRDFLVTATQQGKKFSYDLRAKSSKNNFQRIILTFSGPILSSLRLYDQLGQITTVQLSHVKNNPQLSSQLFKFKPPKGVDVVED